METKQISTGLRGSLERLWLAIPAQYRDALKEDVQLVVTGLNVLDQLLALSDGIASTMESSMRPSSAALPSAPAPHQPAPGQPGPGETSALPQPLSPQARRAAPGGG